MKKRNQLLLAIAIDRYRSTAFTPLSNAVRDAGLVIEMLQRRYGFELAAEPLFDERATRSNIYGALTDLVAAVDDRDDVVIYFAGHGLQHTLLGIGYWLPYDATEDVSTYITNSEIRNYLAGIRARHIFVLSDSCFSGTFAPPGNGVEWNQLYLDLNELTSRWILTSGGEEVVSDGLMGKTSPFARCLLRFLNENTNKFTSVTDLAGYVLAIMQHRSGQSSRAARIDGTGDKGGEMIFRLKEEYIETRLEVNEGIPHSISLKLELLPALGRGNRLAAGIEIMLVHSFFGNAALFVLVLTRLDSDGSKRVIFQEGKLIVDYKLDEPFAWPLIQRFATWECFFRYWDVEKEKYTGMKVTVMGDYAIPEADDSQQARQHEKLLHELYRQNSAHSDCLHCGAVIDTVQRLLVEIDELGSPQQVGFVHKACLRPADRVLGKMELSEVQVPQG